MYINQFDIYINGNFFVSYFTNLCGACTMKKGEKKKGIKSVV